MVRSFNKFNYINRPSKKTIHILPHIRISYQQTIFKMLYSDAIKYASSKFNFKAPKLCHEQYFIGTGI